MTRRLALLAAITLASTIGLSGVATAQTVDGRDGRQDVMLFKKGEAPRAAPKRVDGDLVGYKYKYTSTRFEATLNFRDLRRSVPHRDVIVLLTWTGDVQNEFAELEVEATPERPGGRASLDWIGGDDNCPVRWRIDYSRNKIVMSFPSRCIKNPVALKASATSAASDRARRPLMTYVDRVPRPSGSEGESGVLVRRG